MYLIPWLVLMDATSVHTKIKIVIVSFDELIFHLLFSEKTIFLCEFRLLLLNRNSFFF